MILRVEQLSKDLLSASFQIMYGDTKVGEMSFQAQMVAFTGQTWNGYVFNRAVSMNSVYCLKEKTFRPFTINIDGAPCGQVYQTRYKESGMFKPWVYYHHVDINGLTADIFSVGCGETVNSSVYMNGEQKAHVERSLTVYNDLHAFDVYALDDNSAFLTVLLCLYTYSLALFKPGEKPIKSVHKGYHVTTEKAELAKYDPEFKKRHFGL